MACESIWLDGDNGLHKIFFDDVSIVEVLKENNELFSDPRFDQLKYMIYDFSHMNNSTFDADQTKVVAKVANVRSNTKDALKIALISRQTPESVTTAEMFCEQMNMCHFQCNFFHSLPEAHVWISSH